MISSENSSEGYMSLRHTPVPLVLQPVWKAPIAHLLFMHEWVLTPLYQVNSSHVNFI